MSANAKEAVRTQIEFYFSDSNLPRDKFLLQLTTTNEDGFVPLETLSTFQRIKRHGVSVEDIAEAVEASSELVLSDDRKSVRRANPLPETIDIDERSIYAKGFPMEDGATTIDSVAEFFSKHGTVRSVRLRRNYQTRLFNGGAFVEFATVDEANAAAAKEIKLSDDAAPLRIEKKIAYLERKREENKARRKKVKASPPTEAEIAAEVAAEVAAYVVVPGKVVHFSGIPADATISREDLMSLFVKYGQVERVDYSRGQVDGYVRYREPAADAALAAMADDDAARTVDGTLLTVRKLDGDDEVAYWHQIVTYRARARVARAGHAGLIHSKRVADDVSADDAAPAKKQKTIDGSASTTSTATTEEAAAAAAAPPASE